MKTAVQVIKDIKMIAKSINLNGDKYLRPTRNKIQLYELQNIGNDLRAKVR